MQNKNMQTFSVAAFIATTYEVSKKSVNCKYSICGQFKSQLNQKSLNKLNY